MFEFIHFKKYELIPLETMVSYQHGTSCVWARILMFLAIFLDASGELKHLVLVLHTGQVPEAMAIGENGTKERNLGGGRWLTGEVTSAHVVIAKTPYAYL
jgi:hypothetical protein